MLLRKESSFCAHAHWELNVEQKGSIVQWGFTREKRKGGERQRLRTNSPCGGTALKRKGSFLCGLTHPELSCWPGTQVIFIFNVSTLYGLSALLQVGRGASWQCGGTEKLHGDDQKSKNRRCLGLHYHLQEAHSRDQTEGGGLPSQRSHHLPIAIQTKDQRVSPYS